MTHKSVDETSFEEALSFFREFLNANGETAPLLWIFEGDVVSKKTDRYSREFWLKLPLPIENVDLAKQAYQLAQQQGFGLGISAFARSSAGLCCSVIVPIDDEDAQYMLMGPESIKFSFVTDMISATEVWSWFKWSLLKSLPWTRRGNFLVYLQPKSNLL